MILWLMSWSILYDCIYKYKVMYDESFYKGMGIKLLNLVCFNFELGRFNFS